MKRLVILALALAACKSAAPAATASGGAPNAPGASTPRAAVARFLGAVKAQDLQAMALAWGDHDGPARDVVPRAQLERRELIMQCYLTHDSYSILSGARAGKGNYEYSVSLTRGTITRQTMLTVQQGPGHRWYVSDAALKPLQDLCAQGSGT